MRPWQSGTFDRERISPVWHPFLPTQAIDSIHSIDLQVLHETGKRLLLLDVDNTLVVWQSEDLSEEVYHWIQEAKRLGFLVCILSNTNRVERLQRICSHLGVDYIRGRMKPSRVMYRLALVKYQVHANQAIMVGDQLMTDVLGANRSGIDAIWVRQMGGHEFGPTKINRFIESQLTSRIYKALVLPENESAADAPSSTGQQILRFGVVGVSSFLINTLFTVLLMRVIHVGGEPMGHVFGSWLQAQYPSIFHGDALPENTASPFFNALASIPAMYNSFVWNRIWTFEARTTGPKTQQASRFFVIAVSGNILAAYLTKVFLNIMPGKLGPALALSALIAAIYNFVGQRLYAFGSKAK